MEDNSRSSRRRSSTRNNNEEEDDDDLGLAYAIVTDNNEPKPAGRPSASNVRSREIGERIRDSLCYSLAARGMERPTQPGFKYNDCGMVYMDY